MKKHLALCLMLTFGVSIPSRAEELSIAHNNSAGAVKLVLGNTVADIYIDACVMRSQLTKPSLRSLI
jgi:hypothetical protein